GVIHRGALEAYIRGASHRGLGDEQLETLVRPWLGDEGQRAFYAQIAQADERFTDEVEPLYGDIAVPVQVVWGRKDTWLPPEHGHRLAEMVPGARLHLVDGAGHLIQYDATAELSDVLSDWLAS